jgi:hypothetical protein
VAHYLFLLHDDGFDHDAMPAGARTALLDRLVTWSRSLKERGHLRAVESLMDDGGKTVRKKRDTIVVDGPYAETKEVVTGLLVVEVEDEAVAQKLASECPLLDHGGAVEIREIAPFPVRP